MYLSRTKVRELLDESDLAPSRALGQNFLCDGGMIDKIVRLSGVGPGDRVIEIGPGLGSLTIGLCRAGAEVVSIEVDKYLLPALRSVVGDFEQDGSLRRLTGMGCLATRPGPSWPTCRTTSQRR
jgi:16S rRNA (adenine1518-N6/adenine1519-N6)-dimethyltransferase